MARWKGHAIAIDAAVRFFDFNQQITLDDVE